MKEERKKEKMIAAKIFIRPSARASDSIAKIYTTFEEEAKKRKALMLLEKKMTHDIKMMLCELVNDDVLEYTTNIGGYGKHVSQLRPKSNLSSDGTLHSGELVLKIEGISGCFAKDAFGQLSKIALGIKNLAESMAGVTQTAWRHHEGLYIDIIASPLGSKGMEYREDTTKRPEYEKRIIHLKNLLEKLGFNFCIIWNGARNADDPPFCVINAWKEISRIGTAAAYLRFDMTIAFDGYEIAE